MVDGITLLPGYANSPGAFTEVLTNNENAPLDAYWRGAEMQYRRKVFDWQKQKVETDALLKSMDFDKTGIRPQDNVPLTEFAKKNMYDYAYENPEALAPSMNNPESLAKANQFKQNESEANYMVARSKQLQKQYDTYREIFVRSGDAEGMERLNEWYQQPDLTKANDFEYVPSPDYNLKAIYDELTSGLKPEVTVGKPQYLAGGKINNPEVTQYSDEDWKLINDRFDSAWNNDSSLGKKYREGVRTHFTNMWNNLGDDQKKIYGSPEEYGRYIQLGSKEVSSKPNVDAITYAPERVGEDGKVTPDSRYEFWAEGVLTNPANLTASLITGKYNNGTISDAQIVDAKESEIKAFLKGTTFPLVNKKEGVPYKKLVLTYDIKGDDGSIRQKTAQILLTPENDYGLQPINNILNQVSEGTKGYVSPESMRERFKKDTRFNNQESQPQTNQQPKQQEERRAYIANGKVYTRQDLIDLGYSDEDIAEGVRLENLK